MILLLVGCSGPDLRREIQGAILGAAVPRPKFTLTATNGRPYDFHAETAGRLTFLYFGYTTCPDVCPMQVATVASALMKLSPADREKVRLVFVTTDPSRDTLLALRAWLDKFDPSFVGLRGTEAEVRAIERSVSVPASFQQKTEDGSLGGYGLAHAAQMVVFTPDDSAHVEYPAGIRVSDIVHDVPLLLRGKW